MRRHGAKGIAHGMMVTLAVSAALLSPRFTTPAYAQTGTVRFDNITTEQGLSQSTVTAILQDRQGFMWFGTEDGLNQYDGYQFTVYKHDPDDPKSLSDDVVYSLCEGRSPGQGAAVSNSISWVTSMSPNRESMLRR
jgi:ligand-binding sensor domain-containing protein